jgi:hypothetical protein
MKQGIFLLFNQTLVNLLGNALKEESVFLYVNGSPSLEEACNYIKSGELSELVVDPLIYNPYKLCLMEKDSKLEKLLKLKEVMGKAVEREIEVLIYSDMYLSELKRFGFEEGNHYKKYMSSASGDLKDFINFVCPESACTHPSGCSRPAPELYRFA